MGRHSETPKNAEVVRTFDNLRWFLTSFAEGHFGLLIVVGRPGISKSEGIKAAIQGRDATIISGHCAACQVYCDLYRHRHRRIILDDAEGLSDHPRGRYLLTALTQTNSVKKLEWHSTSRELQKQKVPQSFQTTSRACIISNKWYGSNAEAEALESRGHLIYFEPLNLEVHLSTAKWFWDQEIFDFVRDHLHLFQKVSCRLYVKAWERKVAGGSWKDYVLHHCQDTTLHLIQQLEDEPMPVSEKMKKFCAVTGLSIASYKRYKKELREAERLTIKPQDVPAVSLEGNSPPKLPEINEDLDDEANDMNEDGDSFE